MLKNSRSKNRAALFEVIEDLRKGTAQNALPGTLQSFVKKLLLLIAGVLFLDFAVRVINLHFQIQLPAYKPGWIFAASALACVLVVGVTCATINEKKQLQERIDINEEAILRLKSFDEDAVEEALFHVKEFTEHLQLHDNNFNLAFAATGAVFVLFQAAILSFPGYFIWRDQFRLDSPVYPVLPMVVALACLMLAKPLNPLRITKMRHIQSILEEALRRRAKEHPSNKNKW